MCTPSHPRVCYPRSSCVCAVRNRAKEIVELLADVEKIRTERRKAKANRAKYIGVGNDSAAFSGGSRYGGFGNDSGSGGGSYGGGGSGSYGGGGSGYDRGASCRAAFSGRALCCY